MIATLNGKDTIKTLANGKFRAHRMAAFWVGDYANFADAKRALEIANSNGASIYRRGIFDGGVNATEEQHLAFVIAERILAVFPLAKEMENDFYD